LYAGTVNFHGQELSASILDCRLDAFAGIRLD
jgi:hypothetical protein